MCSSDLHPAAFDWALLKSQLIRLKAGEAAAIPKYDFRTSSRLDETQPIGPCKAILVEGIYTLWDAEIRDLFDLRVFLHVEADIRFIRRLHRDVRERGRTLDSIIRQYYDTVRPMHHEFLEPTKQYADLVVGEETDIAAQVISARIDQLLRSSGEGAPSGLRWNRPDASAAGGGMASAVPAQPPGFKPAEDRKSTRLNSSH